MEVKPEQLELYRKLFVSRADLYAQAVLTPDAGVRYGPRHLVLDDLVLRDHLDGLYTIGSYLVQPGSNLAHLTVLDVDQDDRGLVENLVWRVMNLGVPGKAIAVEQTGGRGWHIWVLFADWVPAIRAHNLGVVAADSNEKVEVYPKSGTVSGDGLGTLIRLPLGMHPRNSRPSVLYDYRFEPLESLADLEPMPAADVPLVLPEAEKRAAHGTRRGVPCIQAIEMGTDEGMRDKAMFAVALYYRDLGTSSDVTRAILLDIDTRNRPPMGPRLVEQKVESAYQDRARIGCSNETLKAFCRVETCRYRNRKLVTTTEARSWKAGDLMHEVIPPIRWIIEGFLSEGFGLVSGKPKIGKSWFCLDLAIAVSTGQPFLGFRTIHAPVLYLALEDGEARIQDRLRKLHCPDTAKMQIEFDFPRFGGDADGITKLEELLSHGFEEEPFGLVIVDSFAASKNTKSEELSPEDMEEIVRPLQKLGVLYHCLILIIHHHRKNATGDVIWDSRGSGAIVAIADVALGLYQEKESYHLLSRSRTTEEHSLWLNFDAGKWQLVGSDDDMGENEAQHAILKILSGFPNATAAQISQARGTSVQATYNLLTTMTQQGLLMVDHSDRERRWSLAREAAKTLGLFDFGE